MAIINICPAEQESVESFYSASESPGDIYMPLGTGINQTNKKSINTNNSKNHELWLSQSLNTTKVRIIFEIKKFFGEKIQKIFLTP